MKKFAALILTVLIVVTSAVNVSAERTLVYSETNGADTIVGKTALAFKEKLEELSGGQIKVDIMFSGVLGTEKQILDDLIMGGDCADIVRISAYGLSTYGCPKSTLLSLPYTFTSSEHFWNFAGSELAKEFLLEPITSDTCDMPVRGLFYFHEGFRHFFFKEEVTSAADLKGMKLRVSDDPVMTGMVKSLDAIPTVVSFSELYSALQTGVADGADQPITNYRSNAFHEVAPYLMLDGHTMGAAQVIIREDLYQSLTEEERGWLDAACAYASDQARGFVDQIEADTLAALKADGCHIIPVSKEEKAELGTKCIPTVTQYVKGFEDIYQQLLDMQ